MNTFDENRKESDEHFFDSIGSSLSPSEEQEKDNRPELIRGSVWKVITINFFETQICRPLSKKCNNNSMSLRVKKKTQKGCMAEEVTTKDCAFAGRFITYALCLKLVVHIQ